MEQQQEYNTMPKDCTSGGERRRKVCRQRSSLAAAGGGGGLVGDGTGGAGGGGGMRSAADDQNSNGAMIGDPRHRSSANARERDRTHSVNSAFIILRQLIPTEPADRKLSKIETLRLATSYISHLHTILMVGLDVVEQPCIKHQALMDRRMDENTRRLMGSPNICTFCLSASKLKNQHMIHDSCMYRTDTRGGLLQISR